MTRFSVRVSGRIPSADSADSEAGGLTPTTETYRGGSHTVSKDAGVYRAESNGGGLIGGVILTENPTELPAFTSIEVFPGVASWTEIDPGKGGLQTVSSIKYADNLWVATITFQLETSPDGINWTLRNASSKTKLDVVYANNLWVVVGFDGDLRTSPDGITWTRRESGFFGNEHLYAILYGNGLFVAAGKNGITTSPDGITWTRISSSPNNIKYIAYGNGVFVGAASNGVIATSPDGITWTEQQIASFTVTGEYYVAYGADLFVAVTSNSNTTVIYTSSDGISWEYSFNTTRGYHAITYDAGLFVAITDRLVLTSLDGIYWKAENPSLTILKSYQSGRGYRSIGYGDGFFVVGGRARQKISCARGLFALTQLPTPIQPDQA